MVQLSAYGLNMSQYMFLKLDGAQENDKTIADCKTENVLQTTEVRFAYCEYPFRSTHSPMDRSTEQEFHLSELVESMMPNLEDVRDTSSLEYLSSSLACG